MYMFQAHGPTDSSLPVVLVTMATTREIGVVVILGSKLFP